MGLSRWARARFERAGLVLLYHRIAELDLDPWELAVSPAHFEAHLDVIRRSATVLSLSDLIRHLENGAIPRRAVVVTFDDGYADNLVVAKPLLERYDVSATMFISTGPLGTRHEFWWDELESVLLTGAPLPPHLELELDGDSHQWMLEPTIDVSQDAGRYRHWHPWEPPPTQRHAAFAEIWRHLRTLREPARRPVLDRLAAWSGRNETARTSHRTLSYDDLRDLADSRLIDVGAHTVTHSRLSALADSEQRFELMTSRQHLQDVLGRPVISMSYPFGGREDYTSKTVAMAREAGFACACASVPGPVDARTDRFQVPRHFVGNVDGARFEEMLHQWSNAA